MTQVLTYVQNERVYLVSLYLSGLQLRRILLMGSVVSDHFTVLLLVLLDAPAIDER